MTTIDDRFHPLFGRACAALLMTALLAGCGGMDAGAGGYRDAADVGVGQEEAQDWTDDDGLDEAPSSSDREVGLINGVDGVPIEYVVDREGDGPSRWRPAENHSECYVEHDGLCYPIISPACEPLGAITSESTASAEVIGGWNLAFTGGELVSDGEGYDYSEYDCKAFPIRVTEGDRVITTEARMSLTLTPIADDGLYMSKGRDETRVWTQHDEVAGVSLEDLGADYDAKRQAVTAALEAKGLRCHSFENASSLWASDVPTVIELGDYEGTKWVEQDAYVDLPIVSKPEGPTVIRPEVVKTHEGYFVIDLSEVPAGEYMLSNVSGNHSLKWSESCWRVRVS